MEPISRSVVSTDWITVVIFASLFFAVVAKQVSYARFLNFIILPFNNKYIFMYNKKDRLFNSFNILFGVFQLLNYSLFIYLCRPLWQDPAEEIFPFLYIVIFGLLLTFSLIKLFLQLANGFFFNNTKLVSELIFKKLSYLFYSSIIVFLANICLVYIFKDSRLVIYITAFLVIAVNLVGWVTILKNYQKEITTKFFYFILYLCALEIAPIVIFVNALTK